MLPDVDFDPLSAPWVLDVRADQRDDLTPVEVPVLPQQLFTDGFE